MKSKIAILNNPSSWLFNQKAERNQMNRQKSKSTFSTTLPTLMLALILGGAGFLGSPAWAAEITGFSSEAAKKAGPQYGGTITFLDGYGAAQPPITWHKGEGAHWATGIYHEPMYVTLLAADFERFGPRGSGVDGTLHSSMGPPLDFVKGRLAESWSLPDANTIIFNLRRGIMWPGKPGVMESREVTAEDVVYSYKLGVPRYNMPQYQGVESVTATDRYTVTIKD